MGEKNLLPCLFPVPARFSHFFLTERLFTTISEPGTGYSFSNIVQLEYNGSQIPNFDSCFLFKREIQNSIRKDTTFRYISYSEGPERERNGLETVCSWCICGGSVCAEFNTMASNLYRIFLVIAILIAAQRGKLNLFLYRCSLILVSNKKRRSVEVQFQAYLFPLRFDNGPQRGRKPSVDWS